MRGSAGPPASTARRSARAPAAKTAKRARVSPRACRRAMRPSLWPTPLTPAPVATGTPRPASSSASAPATSPKSTIPVTGECSADSPTQWGSTSAISSRDSRRSPGTPFSRPRRSSSSSGASSLSSRATISLPQRS